MRRCAFCQAEADRELWGELVCQRCASRFWRIGERMSAGASLRCEACGAVAVDVVDGHPLCADCHLPIADTVSEQVRALSMADTLRAIRELPEASA